MASRNIFKGILTVGQRGHPPSWPKSAPHPTSQNTHDGLFRELPGDCAQEITRGNRRVGRRTCLLLMGLA